MDTSTFGCRFLFAALVSPLERPRSKSCPFLWQSNQIFLFTAAHIIIFKNSTQCCVIAVVYLVIQRSPAINFELLKVHCFSVSGNDHFRHHVLRCTSIDITWYKFPPLSLFLLGTSYLVRKAKLSEEKPLPFGQRVRRLHSVSRAQ